MNAKAKRYYQDINKENNFNKQYRVKQNAERDASKASCQVLVPCNAAHAHNQSRERGHSPTYGMQRMAKVESKKNLIGRQIQSKERIGALKFPKITREEPTPLNRKKNCRSFKKLATEPSEIDDELFAIRTLSPKDNMK